MEDEADGSSEENVSGMKMLGIIVLILLGIVVLFFIWKKVFGV